MATCSDNEAIEKLKELQAGLDAKLAEGQAKLDELKADMTSMVDQLTAFKPEIPVITSLQQELKKLSELEDPIQFARLKAELQEKFDSAEAKLDETLKKLKLDEFEIPIPGILKGIDLKSICDVAPNVEADAEGNQEVQPEPPKIPPEPPKPPPKKVVFVADSEDNNRKALQYSYDVSKKIVYRLAGNIFLFGKKKIEDEIYRLTMAEVHIFLLLQGGVAEPELNTYKAGQVSGNSLSVEGLRKRQEAILKKYKPKHPLRVADSSATSFDDRYAEDPWDFKFYNREIEPLYNDSSFAEGPFTQACVEFVRRREKKLGLVNFE